MAFCSFGEAKIENISWQGLPAVLFCAGGFEALMIPDVGGNVIRLTDVKRGLDILRMPPDANIFKKRPQIFGIPVLFPPNRIEDGEFTAAGRTYKLKINEIQGNNHLHGFLHTRPWKVTLAESRDNEAKVEVTFTSDCNSDFYNEFPHEFEFKILYILSENGLTQKVTIINKGNTPMPLGLGFHTAFKIPFHPESLESDYKMRVSIGKRWELNDRILPTGVLKELDTEDLKYRLEGVEPTGHLIDLAHFTAEPMEYKGKEFNGAIVEDTSKGLKLVYETGKGYKHWMLWNKSGEEGFICPEPQTWAVNAPNIKLPDEATGFTLLAPNGVWEDTCRIYIEEE